MHIAYPEPYLVLAGAPALGALVFRIPAFALFVITDTVLTSAGQPRVAALIAGLALGVVLLATQLFISAAGPNQGALIAAALGTCAGTVFALLGAGAAVYARFKAFLPPLSVVRGGLAGAGAFMSVAALAGGHFAFRAGRTGRSRISRLPPRECASPISPRLPHTSHPARTPPNPSGVSDW